MHAVIRDEHMFLLAHSRNLYLNMKKIFAKLSYCTHFGKILEKEREGDPSFIYIYFFLHNTIEQLMAIIAIYMTQARICTKGLNLSLLDTRNKHMSRRLHVISQQGKGDRFMNVNPDRSPCALNLTSPPRLSPPTSPLRERVIAIECSQLPSCRSSSVSETTALMHVVTRNYDSEPNNHTAVAWVARKAWDRRRRIVGRAHIILSHYQIKWETRDAMVL